MFRAGNFMILSRYPGGELDRGWQRGRRPPTLPCPGVPGEDQKATAAVALVTAGRRLGGLEELACLTRSGWILGPILCGR